MNGDRCTVCGKNIKVQILRGTGVCCGNCKKKAKAVNA